jgi:hypothetical protein
MMSLRDQLRVEAEKCRETTADPEWVNNGTQTTKILYKHAVDEYQRITQLVDSGEISSATDTRIVLSKVAQLAKKDKSLINKRRQPELCEWIAEKNNLLELRYNKSLDRRKKNSRPKPTLSALNEENIKLRAQKKNVKEDELRAIVEKFFDSNILDDRDKQAREIFKLREENKMLRENLEHLKFINNRLTEQVAKLINDK